MAKAQQLIDRFPAYDKDNDGKIDTQEFSDLMTELGIPYQYPGTVKKVTNLIPRCSESSTTMPARTKKKQWISNRLSSISTPSKIPLNMISGKPNTTYCNMLTTWKLICRVEEGRLLMQLLELNATFKPTRTPLRMRKSTYWLVKLNLTTYPKLRSISKSLRKAQRSNPSSSWCSHQVPLRGQNNLRLFSRITTPLSWTFWLRTSKIGMKRCKTSISTRSFKVQPPPSSLPQSTKNWPVSSNCFPSSSSSFSTRSWSVSAISNSNSSTTSSTSWPNLRATSMMCSSSNLDYLWVQEPSVWWVNSKSFLKQMLWCYPMV